jgi:septal ring factor EnvC (AmiA/AmiB activator)
MNVMYEGYLMMENFKSPVKKLTVFFKNSRDKWKEKCKQAMLDIRSLKKRIEFLEQSKSELKLKLKELKAKNKQLQHDLNKSEEDKKKILGN